MSTEDLSVSYDDKADVLYVTAEPPVAASSDEGAPGILWRHAIDNGRVVGVTVLDFSFYWRPRIEELVNDLSRGLALTKSEARRLLERVHPPSTYAVRRGKR